MRFASPLEVVVTNRVVLSEFIHTKHTKHANHFFLMYIYNITQLIWVSLYIYIYTHTVYSY